MLMKNPSDLWAIHFYGLYKIKSLHVFVKMRIMFTKIKRMYFKNFQKYILILIFNYNISYRHSKIPSKDPMLSNFNSSFYPKCHLADVSAAIVYLTA